MSTMTRSQTPRMLRPGLSGGSKGRQIVRQLGVGVVPKRGEAKPKPKKKPGR